MKKITLINELEIERELPDKKRITVGKSSDNDVVIGEPFLSDSVSRKHCEIFYGSEIMIMDMGSTYGTYLNNYKIIPERKIPLKNEDILKLGKYKLKVEIK